MKALLLVMVVAALLVQRSAPSVTKPSPEQAKAALLTMMRSDEGQKVEWFADGKAAEALAAQPIERDERGSYAWGPFSIDLRTRRYNLFVQPQPDSGACSFEYEGNFIQHDRQWSAAAPKNIGIMTPAR